MMQFLTVLDRRAVVINMDFANDAVPYTAAIDVRELITLETAMKDERLGPNGGLVFCMEKLVSNIAWLTSKIESLRNDPSVLSF
jgi:GPN-loop GTPase